MLKQLVYQIEDAHLQMLLLFSLPAFIVIGIISDSLKTQEKLRTLL